MATWAGRELGCGQPRHYSNLREKQNSTLLRKACPNCRGSIEVWFRLMLDGELETPASSSKALTLVSDCAAGYVVTVNVPRCRQKPAGVVIDVVLT
jgi:hypothetical protein